MEPVLHTIVSRMGVSNRGKNYVAFKLRSNPRLYDEGICRGIDTEVFYPDKDIFKPEEEATFVRMCAECPVMELCQEWGLVHERYGVWGGLTPFRRQQERKRRGWMVSDPRGFGM
jgi:hypothetical protein